MLPLPEFAKITSRFGSTPSVSACRSRNAIASEKPVAGVPVSYSTAAIPEAAMFRAQPMFTGHERGPVPVAAVIVSVVSPFT